MKKILLLLFISSSSVFSQTGYEILIHNYTSHNNTINVKIYPASMIFNGTNEYNLLAKEKNLSDVWQFYYLNGVAWDPDEPNLLLRKKTYYTLNQGEEITINADADISGNNCHLGFGLGKYKVEVWWENNILTEPPDESFTIEYDPGYYTNPRPPFSADLLISFFDNTNNPNIEDPRMEFTWGGDMANFPPLKVRDEEYKIEAWNQYQSGTRPKEFGNFHYGNGTTQTPNNYSIFPQDPRRDCVSEIYPQYQVNQNDTFNYAYTINNINYYGAANIGTLTLKLTIEKSITTPDYLSFQFGQDGYEPVFPSPIVIANGATLILTKGNDNNTLERRLTFKQYKEPYTNNPLNFNTNLVIDPNGTLELQGSSNSSEKARMIFEPYSYSEIYQTGNLKLGEKSLMELTHSNMTWYSNSNIYFYGNGTNAGKIWLKTGSVLTNCGAHIIGPLTITQDGGTIRLLNNCSLPLSGGPFETLIDSGGCITVNSGSILEVGNGGKMILDGSETKLILSEGSRLTLGEGASIEFRNGAYLEANGCTFTSINSGEIWNGIVLDGAGSQTSIQNCTFNDAATSISVTNTVCNITGNTFNISNNTNCVYGINAVNENNITISSNTFNAGSNSVAECIKFFNYDGDGLPGGGGIPAYSLNIFNNSFYGSVYPIDIQCLTASQLPFYISYNQFYPEGGITANGIFAYNITGNIKNNVFYNSHSNKGVSLQFSSVNLYNNTLQSAYQNIWSNNSTVMHMAPIQNEFGQWVWYGGYNKLTSTDNYNIEFRGYSNPIVSPNGLNCFNVNTQPNFIGEICLGSKPYRAYDNYWSPTPTSLTFNITCNNNPVNVTYSPNLTYCPDIDPGDIVGSYVSSLGNSLYDTVFVTSSGGTGGSKSSNEITIKKSSNTTDILYFEAIQKRKVRDYAGAINKCKELINDHDTSSYFNSALSELYLNYLQSDTSGNQTITNGLFNSLKTYIEQKMEQYTNNTQFIEKAYKYLLMCLVKTKNYSEAIAGYENIMNNHPDPIVRLNASWDRSAVVFMMGEGGSNNDLNKATNKSRNKKLLDKNPAHKIAENIFKDQKEESKRIEKNNELYNVDAVNTVKYTKQEKAEIERRIENYNPTDKKDFMAKLSSDIKLLEVINTSKVTKKVNNNLPKAFKLLQNYPNPFNPITNIKYEIPKDAFVTLKIYDLLGKEVFGINEFKKAGSYDVKFDGRNLASGMYFYSLESSGYKDTKKMVLIK